MKCKTAYLIINPMSGKSVAKLADMIAVLSAADWKIDTALKEFGGHTMQLARKAAEAGYDLVIACGGDGTLNQVINGVMAAKRRRSIVGVIPGGTANVWAHEIGIPEDPVKAALLLINSAARKVDLGHVQVDSLPFAPGSKNGQKKQKKKRLVSGGRHHFLLMAGLGMDAAILRRVSTPLKGKMGEAAVALAALEELPSQHAFPIEIRSSDDRKEKAVLWRGEALQVVIGNTRRYGNIAEVTPEAHIDDGVLDVCVITAGNPLTTLQQVLATLLHRKPVRGRSEYFQGAHFSISVPASVNLQVDGSLVKLKDCLATPDRAALRETGDSDAVMVTYRFDAMPHTLRAAIPCTYNGALFEGRSGKEGARAIERRHPGQGAMRADEGHEPIDALLEQGRKVTVVAVGPNPERKGTTIVAGEAAAKRTNASKPVAVRIDRGTTLATSTGEPLPAGAAAELPAGGVIIVEGKQSKRGVIRAKRVVVT
jgi:YegS/Rv2252/BmrU family lipid kinase